MKPVTPENLSDELIEALSEIKIVTSYHLDYDTLDKIIQEFYSQLDFEFCADHEASNDSSYEFSITPFKISEYQQKKLLDFKNGVNHSGMTRILLQDLCNNGVLPAGNYTVSVSW